MPRKLRFEQEGGLPCFQPGNYRAEVFGTEGQNGISAVSG